MVWWRCSPAPRLFRAERGDVIVVPPRLSHAFSAGRGNGADLLVVIAPGVDASNTSANSHALLPVQSFLRVCTMYSIYTAHSSWKVPNGSGTPGAKNIFASRHDYGSARAFPWSFTLPPARSDRTILIRRYMDLASKSVCDNPSLPSQARKIGRSDI
jgi:hypothetical protein